MKRLAWILLLLSALVQPLNKAGIYVLFQANRAYIASTLCENRALPASACKGACFLKKELAQGTSQEKQIPKRGSHGVELVLYVQELETEPTGMLPAPPKTYSLYKQRIYKCPDSFFFHPPQLLSRGLVVC